MLTNFQTSSPGRHAVHALIGLSLLALCAASAWEVFAQRHASAYKFGEFEYTNLDEAKPHADQFAAELKKDTRARAVLVGYSPRVSYYEKRYNAGLAAASQVRFLLSQRRDGGIAPEQILMLDGGYRDAETVEMFVVPPGARLPKPTPAYPASAAVRCARIRVNPPMYVWEEREPLTFAASLGDLPPGAQPKYGWTVSAGGRILSGQGTARITVEPPSPNYRPVTATVVVGGFSTECDSEASAAAPESMTVPLKLDEFGRIACGDELARLDNLLQSLHSDARLRAYVVVRDGRDAKAGEARARAARMKSYLTYRRGIAFARIVAVVATTGGVRDELRGEFWLVPRGGDAPLDDETVRAGEVLKRRAKRRPSDCEDSYGSM